MSVQLRLITEPAARVDGPDTSRAAAGLIKHTEGPRAALIRECFRLWGELTDDELCQKLGEPVRRWPTVKSHRSRLSGAGKVEPTGAHRPSVSGVDQQVWRWVR